MGRRRAGRHVELTLSDLSAQSTGEGEVELGGPEAVDERARHPMGSVPGVMRNDSTRRTSLLEEPVWISRRGRGGAQTEVGAAEAEGDVVVWAGG